MRDTAITQLHQRIADTTLNARLRAALRDYGIADDLVAVLCRQDWRYKLELADAFTGKRWGSVQALIGGRLSRIRNGERDRP